MPQFALIDIDGMEAASGQTTWAILVQLYGPLKAANLKVGEWRFNPENGIEESPLFDAEGELCGWFIKL